MIYTHVKSFTVTVKNRSVNRFSKFLKKKLMVNNPITP